MTHIDAIPVRITGWDRAAIVTLGAAGCALSYDALQQMAVAIHIRGLLTYLFPFVIDGFIGYGVRAVLVMRSASLGARCYVWALFGVATAASIWANALHAVRLNDRAPGGGGLQLGDVAVGVLSTLAPLALAGAVHLYILIARRAAQPGHPDTAGADTSVVRTERVTDVPADSGSVRGATENPEGRRGQPDTGSEDAPEHKGRDAVLGGEPDARSGHPAPNGTPAPGPSAGNGDAETGSPSAPGETEDLLPIARRAVSEAGKLTRQVVADAIRGQGIPLSNDRLTELMQQLRTEAGNRTLRSTG
ncbi:MULTISPECIES: DUF2637 domain-containing protein [unclassified Streptomyces]|uniref:DUF2637 domain-containing protein n=1 Tax=unclassified Streptomyces TaxID=2593676 RepID=UPI002DDA7BC5|nr:MULTISPECIES: DUF2637 domain-containing protein [unclassified Streptomyces]WSA96660.1 DUF2637 domain-containing protein [Streptomyces sp. NBC_01795]WSB81075.1 DUF2637 domain-containing protein [Streptomyces sp. NBC_01775]WSS10715.1 DUF2637 domain-containing protein [Streptomyces sp. NBC_01186]WSS39410.1 DUF2637 domain-containing protein [Streptomyces sp. NBC_01187]